jgi:hypothetical protein
MARKGCLGPEDVPHTLGTEALLAFLKNQRKRSWQDQ